MGRSRWPTNHCIDYCNPQIPFIPGTGLSLLPGHDFVVSLAKKHPHPRIEQACQAVLEAKTFSYKALKEELDWLAKQAAVPLTPETLPTHANIRGQEYYQ